METEKKNKNRNERSILLNRLSSLASWHPFMRSTGAHKTSCTLTGARFGLGHASSVKQSPHLGWIVTPRLKKFQEATQTKATMTTHRLKPHHARHEGEQKSLFRKCGLPARAEMCRANFTAPHTLGGHTHILGWMCACSHVRLGSITPNRDREWLPTLGE